MRIPSVSALADRLFDGTELIKAVFSKPFAKSAPKRVTAEPLAGKYQFTEFVGDAVMHSNLNAQWARKEFARLCGAYGQADIRARTFDCKVLSKTGRSTITAKSRGVIIADPDTFGHNREKNYILKEGEAAPFLVKLGIMEANGRVKAAGQKKFRQLNRYLEMIRDVLGVLPRSARIVDFGCGKAYLSFALYHYLHDMLGMDVTITGLDLKRDVVAHCEDLARELGYEGLSFSCGSIEDFAPDEGGAVDMVISLHACDTATDYSIYQARKWGAKVIMAVPCCQHEVNAGLAPDGMLTRHGLVKERLSALITDAVRAEIMRLWGYKTDVMEFIDMEHTPKNILLRGCKAEGSHKKPDSSELERYIASLGVCPTLWRLYNQGV